MPTSPTRPSLRILVGVSLAVYTLFAIPSLALLALAGLLPIAAAAFFFVVFAVTGIPVTTLFTWGLWSADSALGTPISLMAACAIPAQLYMFLAGGLVGNHFFGPIGGLVVAAAMFLVGKFLGFKLAKALWIRLTPTSFGA